MSVTCPKCNHNFTLTSKLSAPKDGTVTAQVWEMCDALQEELGKRPSRTEVLTKGMELQLNPSTVLTQFGRWAKFNKVAE